VENIQKPLWKSQTIKGPLAGFRRSPGRPPKVAPVRVATIPDPGSGLSAYNALLHPQFDAGGQMLLGAQLTVSGSAQGVSAEDFARIAQDAKNACPVSKALTGTDITLEVGSAGNG